MVKLKKLVFSEVNFNMKYSNLCLLLIKSEILVVFFFPLTLP